MKQNLIAFFHRGLIFGGFGPIVTCIVLFCIELSGTPIALSATELLIMALSMYLLAFVHAGASVFHQIEGWPLAKCLLYHFLSLYTVYSICYLINRWVPFEPIAFAIFTAAFVLIYLTVWLAVYCSIRASQKRLNRKLGKE
ncbi:MAG: DUF3021 domain-containing protein [Clostridia bacterium]|nr:DUF3021 domain-containing protein [Clostridia bacterium]